MDPRFGFGIVWQVSQVKLQCQGSLLAADIVIGKAERVPAGNGLFLVKVDNDIGEAGRVLAGGELGLHPEDWKCQRMLCTNYFKRRVELAKSPMVCGLTLHHVLRMGMRSNCVSVP